MAKKDFNLKPLEDRIVVKPGDEEETTVSGIVIPDTAKEKPQEGSVVAVGPGRFEEGARVALGVAGGGTATCPPRRCGQSSPTRPTNPVRSGAGREAAGPRSVTRLRLFGEVPWQAS